MSIPDRTTFENMYSGQPPWDIGRPQKAFIDMAVQITGSILDAGCGTGENALFFASSGYKVTGIDKLGSATDLGTFLFGEERPASTPTGPFCWTCRRASASTQFVPRYLRKSIPGGAG